MKNDDLTQVKHIGPSRMKVLNDNGIRTIKQLYETPLDKLARIASIGERYAKLIKDAVAEYYGETARESIAVPETVPGKEKEIEEIQQDLQKGIKTLHKRLKRANEVLKPLGKKKYLELYIDFKKRSKTLKNRIDALNQNQGKLPDKRAKSIIKKADALNTTLKNVSKKTKKKKYKKLCQEIRSFSKMLRDASV
jgi:nucleotidyltransferase/DNA polymerase involved in DNA repair